MRFDILTIFPKIFNSYFGESILRRAQEKGLVTIQTHDIRAYTKDKHRKVDDRPFGGGAGMVLTAQPVLAAVEHVLSVRNVGSGQALPAGRQGSRSNKSNKRSDQTVRTKIVIMSAKGKLFNQKMAYDWAKKYNRLVFVSGRYEGIDERVKTILKAEEVSIGPYVLTDGDVAVMTIVSAVSRLIPGVIRLESLAEESHWNLLLKKEAQVPIKVGIPTGVETVGGLEYPHFTRPEVLVWKGKKYRVPKVLLGGNHKEIDAWRKNHS